MKQDDFNNLAERILLALIASPNPSIKIEVIGTIAVSIADNFVRILESQRELTPAEITLIKNGNTIGAIKEVRNRTGLCLKEAKEMVDRERRKLGI